MTTTQLIEIALKASLKAGAEILDVYNSEFAIEHKDDKSPLTEADKRGHVAIVSNLESTQLPVLSEEGKSIDYSERSRWEMFWMVDPLDGTKEFIKRNGEFTVNIALIEKDTPIGGVIYVPVHKTLYVAAPDLGSYKIENVEPDADGVLTDLVNKGVKLPQSNSNRPYTVVASRSHMSAETADFIESVKQDKGEVETMSRGSSLKLCMVAEGSADAYPRYAPTMEWDTAAGDAICRLAGFSVTQYQTEAPLIYNKENLLNPWFLVK